METLIVIIGLIILAETSYLVIRRSPAVRAIIPSGNASHRSILVDTSVLIDGRIVEIATAGFIPGKLIIPRSVLGELQLLADGSDPEKRNRARNGLEVITQLQKIPAVTVEIHADQSEAREGVDNRLLALARELGYELCTVDYNLQKVAQAEGITILSINELSQKLRALYLPGEKVELTLKQKGQEKGQAIGYASDGTMVVVDSADKLMNQTVSVEVIRSLQTASGKMMFAKLVNKPPQQERPRSAREAVKNIVSRPQRTQAKPADAPVDAAQQTREPRKPFGNRNNRRPNQQPQQRGSRQSQSPEDELLNLVNKQ